VASREPRGSAAAARLPDPDELFVLAYHGESRHVHALLARVPRGDWPRYATPLVLLEAIRGGVDRARSLPLDAVAAQDRQHATVEAMLRLLLARSRADRTVSRELVLAVICWIDELVRVSQLEAATRWCEALESLGAVAYPDLRPRLILRWAAVLSARGLVAEADSLLRACYARPDLVSDPEAVPALVEALGATSLRLGRAGVFKRLAFDGLRAFFAGIAERRALLASVLRAHRGLVRLLTRADVAPADKIVVLLHWMALSAPRRLAGRTVMRALERGLLAGVYALRYAHPLRAAHPARRLSDRAPHAQALVTRAMGGVGDLLMMTPGLHALRRASGDRPVRLAVPRRYLPLFDGNEDVEVVDIHGDLDATGQPGWVNLTDCPAARVESLTAPRVRRNRIEIFARAMGVRGAALRGMTRRPRYVVTEDERAWRDRFLASCGLSGATIVGVQMRADEAYRTPPHMPAIVAALSRRWPVLAFDTRRIDVDLPNVVKVERADLRAAFALASGCRVVVAPDSAFVHLSAALDVPCVALFGPTDGRVRAGDYPRCRVVDARRTLPCVPCWRNEETACRLMGARASVCLAAIDVTAVLAAVEAALR
jgi:hypothetical protein